MSKQSVTLLGLGAMGRALGNALLAGGHPLTVWNRTPGRDTELVAAGATSAATPGDAAAAGSVILVCLLDHRSVHDTLDPIADRLRGKQVINLTSTTPEQSRRLADWASEHGVSFLDGAIMAVPEMIGRDHSSLLYSGTEAVFDQHRESLELFGTAEYFGGDAGIAAQVDFALLAAMYGMFGAVFHGMALAAEGDVAPTEFAPRVTAWLSAMLTGIEQHAQQIESGEYETDVQSLNFNKTGVDEIVQASRDAGIDTAVLEPMRALINRQVAAGHGELAFARVYESIRHGS